MIGVKKFFRTYLPFAANEIKSNLAYKGAFYLFMLCSLFSSFINYYLWKAIYGSSGASTLGGLSSGEMVIYVFMTYVTSNMVMIRISNEISEDVVKGNVAMQLIKPIDYRLSQMFMGFGYSVYRFIMPGIFVWIGVEIYRAVALNIAFTGVVNVLLYLCSAIMSLIIYMLFEFCFAMIAFFTTYIFGLKMVKAAMISFLTGQLIPLSFFPEIVQKIFEFMPFSSMLYTPVMIYLGKFTGNDLLFALLKQMLWVVILYLLGSYIWKRVTKRLVVLGG